MRKSFADRGMGGTMKTVPRRFNIDQLVNELGNNKIDSLEILREALSNAKDHGAGRLFVRTSRDNQGRVSVLLVDDGEGLDDERWAAFWGVAASAKPPTTERPSIGYKGFGTKLFFQSERLVVASRPSTSQPWMVAAVDRPFADTRPQVDLAELDSSHPLYRVLQDVALVGGTGTAVSIEHVRFSDRDRLLLRRNVESYCDWFTIIGDVRSGLFDSRAEFHRAIRNRGETVDLLQPSTVPLRPVEVLLQVNGETKFSPLGLHGFYKAWPEDQKEFAVDPGLAMFGHRFADARGATVTRGGQAKDDRTALRLTGPKDWLSDEDVGVVAHVEGQRRQRDVYDEAGWPNHKGVYSFDERFGLWLCRDYVPVVQRNDLLRRAILEAEPRGLERDFKNLRNWKVFVNDQGFLPTANRGDISNFAEREGRVHEALLAVLKNAFKHADFADWVEKIRAARRERERDVERDLMKRRRDDVEDWAKKGSPKGVDVSEAALRPRNARDALMSRIPRNEQELYSLWAQVSARFEVPLMVLEYDTHDGVDAIARVREAALLPGVTYARVEFKLQIDSGYPIGHYFDAIDAIVCWNVGKTGDIEEENAAGFGRLRTRARPLAPPLDTYEIAYTSAGTPERVIPVLEVKTLFASRPMHVRVPRRGRHLL